MKRSVRVNGLHVLIIVIAFAVGVSEAQTHPSGLSSRVMVAVQQPTGIAPNNVTGLAPQLSLQILNASANKNAQKYVSGWSGAMPAKIESLPSQGVGAVYSEDGSLSIVNYNSESVTSQPISGPTAPAVSSLLSQSLQFVFTANQQAGQLTAIDLSAGIAVKLSIPEVYGVSVNVGSTVVLAFAQNSNLVYYVQRLGSNLSQAYANGSWPTNAADCEPYALPTFCAMVLTAPGVSPATFANQNFDHPIKALTSADNSFMYVLNGGPEWGGTQAGVTAVPVAPILLYGGSGTMPSSLDYYYTPGGADNGLVAGNTLYIAGQYHVSPGLWAGELSVINTSTATKTTQGSPGNGIAPQSIADGTPTRMILGDNNTLWIGSTRCNTGPRFLNYNTQGGKFAYGCLTVVDMRSQTPTFIESWSCTGVNYSDGENGNGCGPDVLAASGDVTGLASITGQGKVYYAERGQLYIRSTIYSGNTYPIIPFSPPISYGPEVPGTVVDVVYMDANVNPNPPNE